MSKQASLLRFLKSPNPGRGLTFRRNDRSGKTVIPWPSCEVEESDEPEYCEREEEETHISCAELEGGGEELRVRRQYHISTDRPPSAQDNLQFTERYQKVKVEGVIVHDTEKTLPEVPSTHDDEWLTINHTRLTMEDRQQLLLGEWLSDKHINCNQHTVVQKITQQCTQGMHQDKSD
ncbi:hypothetical protein Bbelb_378600 [Branchiostoma belcheri]|nr:hypothetical protein Bbelb_378600 [Branchiostoma belcheri]